MHPRALSVLALAGALGCTASASSPVAAPAEAGPLHWTRAREADCDRALRDRIARELRLADPGYCEIQTFESGRERLQIAVIAFGRVEDCPSGCFQRNAGAVVRGERIAGIPTRNSMPYATGVWDAALRKALFEQGVVDAAEQEFRSASDEGQCSVPAALESDGDDIYWVYRLSTPKPCLGQRRAKPTGLRFEVDGEVRIHLAGKPTAPSLRVTIQH